MRAHFHRFLLMLLMLLLPLQAFAAAAMLDCSFQEPAAMEMTTMVAPVMAGCHEPKQPDTPSTQHNCKHCAACALAAALPIPVTDSAAILPTAQYFAPYPAASYSGFVPSGPERPPRLFLA